MTDPSKIMIPLPGWFEDKIQTCDAVYSNVEERMRLIADLSRMNIEAGTGGPFGAGVFELETGKLVSAGVNLVTSANCSVLHAEIVAIMLAQQKLETYNLASKGEFELVTSCEPCAMCLGAIPWSGVKRVVCGARDEDARQIGFDEGCKPSDWIAKWADIGIEVAKDILRNQCRQVLVDYQKRGGRIYNSN